MIDPDKLGNWRWRVSNLYEVANEKGQVVKFVPNDEQWRFMNEMHTLNVIPKARQLGFSTLIQIMGLDTCLFHADTRMGVIAQDRDTAKAIFQLKIRDVYNRLPTFLKDMIPASQEAAEQITFGNNSTIIVGTSLRGGTFQFLHVSELGKIAAKYPEKAKEVKSGAFNTVHPGQHIFVESTSEGQDGLFHDLVMEARDREDQGIEPTELEFKLYFAPWWRDKRYTSTVVRTIPEKFIVYFKELEKQKGITLTEGQKQWYVQKATQQKSDMRREYPSYLEEAFEAPIEGAYYTAEMTLATEQQRIGDYSYDPKLGPVYTFWDLGRRDLMTIWFAQRVGASRWRFFDYIEGKDQSLQWYGKRLLDRQADYPDWVYAAHILPHDGGRKDLTAVNSRRTILEDAVRSPVYVVERTKDLSGASLNSSINVVKNFMTLCAWDRVGCADGLKHLKNYRREWDDKLSAWKSAPFHNYASDGADGFRTAAEADRMGLLDDDYYGNEYSREGEQRARHIDEYAGY